MSSRLCCFLLKTIVQHMQCIQQYGLILRSEPAVRLHVHTINGVFVLPVRNGRSQDVLSQGDTAAPISDTVDGIIRTGSIITNRLDLHLLGHSWRVRKKVTTNFRKTPKRSYPVLMNMRIQGTQVAKCSQVCGAVGTAHVVLSNICYHVDHLGKICPSGTP